MKLSLKLHLARIVITFLNKAYLRVELDKGAVQAWTRKIILRESTRGPVETIGWIKSIRLACTRYLCGQPLKDSPGNGVQLDKDGLPHAAVFPLVELFRLRDPSSVRLGLTYLGYSRLIAGWKTPDLDPITLPANIKDCSLLSRDIVGIVKDLGWKIDVPPWERPHVTTKSGPNAQALIGSIEDAFLLSDSQISNLRVCGGDTLIQAIETVKSISLFTWLSKVSLKAKNRKRRLSLIKDKEAKMRVVAILDYWTQTCFEPLHKAEFRLLKSLRPDCTFNQGGFRTKLPRSGPYYSMDLTAATDRLPVEIQEKVLAELVSIEYAAAWRSLLCDHPFPLTWAPGSVVYGAGQPMGAYSSWTTFAIVHHAIVRLAAKRATLPITWQGYVLLGDDIVLTDDRVAVEYRKIMADLGVSISETKTHVSENTYEFAKRWIHNGLEVTGAPLGSLFEAMRFHKSHVDSELPTKFLRYVSYYEVATWFREVEARWLPRSHTLVSQGLLADFFLTLGRGPLSGRLALKAWKFFLLPSRDDTRLLRRIKCDLLGSMVLGGILGCSHFKKSANFVGIYLNECKARVLEEAIKRQMHDLSRFQLELQRFVDLVPEGFDAQSLLFSLPPFGVLRRNIAELQLEFDKAHSVRDSDDLMQWLHLDVQLFLDPFATLSTRKNKTIASSKATILNFLTAMCAGIAKMREVAVTDISLEQLIEVINHHHVLPTRGDRRKRKERKKIGGKNRRSKPKA
jgi:hypothetical protein